MTDKQKYLIDCIRDARRSMLVVEEQYKESVEFVQKLQIELAEATEAEGDDE